MNYELKEYTFIIITYNHSAYIKDCLDSIREEINNNPYEISTDIIICDDHSSDDTVEKAKKCLSVNDVFRNTLVLENKENLGTVRNILNGLAHVRTEEFKFLAGDDKLTGDSIDEVYKEMYSSDEPSVIITPVRHFRTGAEVSESGYDYNFRVLGSMIKRHHLAAYLKYDNCIEAPGVFTPGRYMRDEGLKRFLLQYRNIEDYPMWIYFFTIKKYPVKTFDKRFICYRLGSGISTSVKKGRSAFSDERTAMHKKLNVRRYILPDVINPFFYLNKILRFMAKMDIKRDNSQEIE